MSNLTTGERIQVRQTLQSPQWQTVERVANLICDEIAYDRKLGETQWKTLQKTVHDQGQIDGIKRLIKELYNLAQS